MGVSSNTEITRNRGPANQRIHKYWQNLMYRKNCPVLWFFISSCTSPPDPWEFVLTYAGTITYASLKSSSQSNGASSLTCCLMSNTWDARGIFLPSITKAKLNRSYIQTPLLLNPKCFQFEVELPFRTMVESSFFGDIS